MMKGHLYFIGIPQSKFIETTFHPCLYSRMELSEAQKGCFVRDGYCVLPNAVPKDLVDAARREINAFLMLGFDEDEVPAFNANTWLPELAGDECILDLFHKSTLAEKLCQSMQPVSENNQGAYGDYPIKHVERGQIALRFPMSELDDGPPNLVYDSHLDGLHSATNGVPVGNVRSFTCLVGVALSGPHVCVAYVCVVVSICF